MTWQLLAMLAFVAVALALPSRLSAQNGRSPAGSSAPMEDGNGSQLPGGFMPEWRRSAERHGVTVTLEEIYDFQGNPSGGRAQKGTVFGRTNGVLQLDLEKLANWKGASLFVNGIFQAGSELAISYVGAWDLTSSIAGTHTFRLNEFYLQQTFLSKKATVRVGQIAAGTEFDNQAIGFDDPKSAFKTWINNTLCCGPPTVAQVFLSAPPAGKPGFLIRIDPTSHFFIKAGVFSGTHSTYVGDESGTRFDLRNAPVAAVSLGWKPGSEKSAHPGVYKIGIIHNFGYFPRFVTHIPTHGNDVIFADAGYALWRARREDGSYSHRGIDAEFSIALAPRVLNPNDRETLAGVRFVGLVPHRPSDIASVGIVDAHFSRDWNLDLAPQGQPRRASQQNLEITYKFVIRRWISIWPDFQYVWKPSGDRRIGSAPILGLRLVFDH